MTSMTMTEFNQNPSRAARAVETSADDAVVVTSRGRPQLVLLSYERFQRLTMTGGRLSEVLRMSPPSDFEIVERHGVEPSRVEF